MQIFRALCALLLLVSSSALCAAQTSKLDSVIYLKGSTVYAAQIESRRVSHPLSKRLVNLAGLKGIDKSATLLNYTNSSLYFLDAGSVWEVNLSGHRAKKIVDCDSAAFFSSRFLLYSKMNSANVSGALREMDMRTHKSILLFANGANPVVASSAAKFAFTQTDSDGDGVARVIDHHSMKRVFVTEKAVGPSDLKLSPTGRYLAVNFHLSRPVTGDTVLDVKSGADISNRYSMPNFLPTLIDDWSPDERYAVVEWRTADPNNDGAWKSSTIGVTSINGKWRRSLGKGMDAHFSLRGDKILWLTSQEWDAPGNLVMVDIKHGTPVIIAKDVTSYLILRH